MLKVLVLIFPVLIRDERVVVSDRPASGAVLKLDEAGSDGALQDLTVSPPLNNIEFFNSFFLNICFSISKFYLYVQSGL
jgi:hypothetical protein